MSVAKHQSAAGYRRNHIVSDRSKSFDCFRSIADYPIHVIDSGMTKRRHAFFSLTMLTGVAWPTAAACQYPSEYGWWCDASNLTHAIGTATARNTDGYRFQPIGSTTQQPLYIKKKQYLLTGDERVPYALRLSPSVQYEIWGRKLSNGEIVLDYFRRYRPSNDCHRFAKDDDVIAWRTPP